MKIIDNCIFYGFGQLDINSCDVTIKNSTFIGTKCVIGYPAQDIKKIVRLSKINNVLRRGR